MVSDTPDHASPQSHHSPVRAPDRYVRTASRSLGTSAWVAPATSSVAGVVRFVVCAARRFRVYSSSLEIPSCVSELLVGRRETLLRGTGISSLSLTRQAVNALVLGLERNRAMQLASSRRQGRRIRDLDQRRVICLGPAFLYAPRDEFDSPPTQKAAGSPPRGRLPAGAARLRRHPVP